ncbi:MFS transporter [Nocardioides cynanchi]|uniref:MFS transporter n=1 Tax=Nocardioides cynanchi TaxID=2558918 RepID=UPI0012473BAF|nr:MFS transporter [Nocardioides cynanchi]
MSARRLPLYGWLTAEAISLLGTRVSMIAIPWLVLVTTGSATRTGLVAAAELTPLVILKATGGPLVDRVGPRRLAIVADSLSMVSVGMIPLLHRSDHLTFPVPLVLVAIGGGLRGPGDAAVGAMVPSLVASAEVPFERATGLASAIERGATMIGAALAGGLVATIGPANAVAVDALSFGVCAVVLLVTTRGLVEPVSAVDGEPTADDEPTSYLAELRAGWDFLRSDALLMSLCLMIAVTNLLDLAWSAVLLPVWARESGAGVGVLGLIFSVWGGASMLGSFVAAAYGTRLPRFTTYVVAFLVTGLPRFVLFAIGVPLWAILAMCVVGGCASGFLNPVLGAVEFERIPPALVGRVTALNSAVCWSLMPLGGVLGGVLVSGIGLDPALLMVGLCYFAATMAPTLLPRFREMDRAVEPAPVAV